MSEEQVRQVIESAFSADKAKIEIRTLFADNFPERYYYLRNMIYTGDCPGCGLYMITDGDKRYYCDECWPRILADLKP